MPSFFPGGAAGSRRHQHVRWAAGGGTGRLGGPRGLREPVRRRLRHGSSPSGPRYHDATGSEGNGTTSRLHPPSQAHVTPGAADRTSGRPRCRYRSPRRCWLGRRWLREPGRRHRGHGGRRGHPGVAGPPSTPVRQRPHGGLSISVELRQQYLYISQDPEEQRGLVVAGFLWLHV